MLAKRYLEEKYPNLKIKVVDSLGASSGYGLLMSYLADLRDEGKTFDACYEWAEANKLNVHHWFFSTDLTSYKRGGRISTTSFFLGQLLKICPLLNMDNLGRLIPRKKVRTKEKTMVEIVKRMEEHAQDGYNYSGKCYMCHSACLDDAKKVASMVEAKFPNLNGLPVAIHYTGFVFFHVDLRHIELYSDISLHELRNIDLSAVVSQLESPEFYVISFIIPSFPGIDVFLVFIPYICEYCGLLYFLIKVFFEIFVVFPLKILHQSSAPPSACFFAA